jgi:hypothetical protein
MASLGRFCAGSLDACVAAQADDGRGDKASSSALAAGRFEPTDGACGESRGLAPGASGDALPREREAMGEREGFIEIQMRLVA